MSTYRDDRLKTAIYQFFPGGGIGRYTHEMASALQRSGEVEVEVICSPRYHWIEAADYMVWPGLQDVWHPSVIQRKWRFAAGQVGNPLRAIRHARQRGYQVLHLANINHLTFPFWRGALRAAGLQLALTVHDVRRQRAMISRRWEDAQLKAVYRAAQWLFVHSEHQKQELMDFAGIDAGRICLVPHGPYPYGQASDSREALRRKYGLDKDASVALFFGQLRNEKNLSGLLRALGESDNRIHLLVAGKTWPGHQTIEQYQSLAGACGLQDRVTFLGRYIPDEEVADLFQLCDWVALPYLHDFTSQSGVLNVAAHYRRPVLVSSAPVLAETVTRYSIGVACRSDQVPDLMEGIRRLMLSREEDFDFDGYLDAHSWDTNARLTIAAYRSVLHPQPLMTARDQ